ncbi:hypothetical protein ACX0HA_09020 [Flavobacterium hauense]
MLTVNQLKEYSADVMAAIPAIKKHVVVVTSEELVKFLNDHTSEENTLMLSLVPGHGMDGSQDNAQWINTTGFYFLEKTDYSQHDHDGYLDIFDRTQNVARRFVNKLIMDKSDNTGLFCGFLAWLDESSVRVDPVKALNGCNGWYVQITMKSNP